MIKFKNDLLHFKNFIPNFIYYFSSNFLFHIFSFFTIIYASRKLTITDFGYLTVAQTIFFLIFSFSFSNIYYYLNKSLVTNYILRRKELGSCFAITFYFSIFLYSLLAIVLLFLDISNDLKKTILILNLILISEPFSIFYSKLFINGQFKKIFKIKIAQLIIFSFLKIYSLYSDPNLTDLVYIYVLENIFFSISVMYYYRKNGYYFTRLDFDVDYIIKILKKIILFPLLSLAILLSMRIDLLMIGAYLGVEQSGYYSSISRLVTVILLLSSQLLFFVYPNMSLSKVLDHTKFINLNKSLILFSFFIGASFMIGSLIFGKYYLGLFGNEFVDKYQTLLLLSSNIFFSLVVIIWVNKNYINSNYFVILAFQSGCIFFNIIFNNYLIPIYGIYGAAISTIVAQLLIFFLINIFKWSEFNIIIQSLSPKFIKNNAIITFRAIFVKKNPDKSEINKL